MLLARPLAAVDASAWSRLVSCHRPGPACLSAGQRAQPALAESSGRMDSFCSLTITSSLTVMPILYPILACLLCSSSSEYGCIESLAGEANNISRFADAIIFIYGIPVSGSTRRLVTNLLSWQQFLRGVHTCVITATVSVALRLLCLQLVVHSLLLPATYSSASHS